MPSAILYTTTLCPVCGMARQLLESLNIPYEEVNVGTHPIARMKLIAQTKKLTVPQTYINGVWISGFHPEKVFEASQKTR